jgi:hypothetical protein
MKGGRPLLRLLYVTGWIELAMIVILNETSERGREARRTSVRRWEG